MSLINRLTVTNSSKQYSQILPKYKLRCVCVFVRVFVPVCMHEQDSRRDSITDSYLHETPGFLLNPVKMCSLGQCSSGFQTGIAHQSVYLYFSTHISSREAYTPLFKNMYIYLPPTETYPSVLVYLFFPSVLSKNCLLTASLQQEFGCIIITLYSQGP